MIQRLVRLVGLLRAKRCKSVAAFRDEVMAHKCKKVEIRISEHSRPMNAQGPVYYDAPKVTGRLLSQGENGCLFRYNETYGYGQQAADTAVAWVSQISKSLKSLGLEVTVQYPGSDAVSL